MLASLSIRDLVLIDRLTLEFGPGLSVLTGETGAGKSILLDALGLALGGRGDSSLVRMGTDQAWVTAEFDLAADHPAHAILREQDIPTEDRLVLRRIIGTDGRSRGYVNDQPAGMGLLRRLGETLVEVHGQFDTQGLLDPGTHAGLLDAYGNLTAAAATVADLYRSWQALERAQAETAAATDRARAEEDYLRHVLAELDSLEPVPGEESALAERRALLLNRGKLVEGMQAALADLTGERGAERGLAAALRHLTRLADKAGGRLDPVIDSLEALSAELDEAGRSLRALLTDDDLDESGLERLEDRLFALRAAARKHGIDVDGLAALRDQTAQRLGLIETEGDRLADLARQAAIAKQAYAEAARQLSAARTQAAQRLDQAVAAELAPLKLDKARFTTLITPRDPTDWNATGIDSIAFAVATNPGSPPGPLGKVASGGELARFTLALKVVLAATGSTPTLVFDEVDAGIGGAVAAAVGDRLAALGGQAQVLVVTHSPQVAARGRHHWHVAKHIQGNTARTDVSALDSAGRCEEIARMLSGSEITPAARAAAASLIADGAA